MPKWCMFPLFSALLLACTAGCTVNAQIAGADLIRNINCLAWNTSTGEKARVYGVTKRDEGGMQFVFPQVSKEARSMPKILAEAKLKPLPGEGGKDPWIVVCNVPRETIPLEP